MKKKRTHFQYSFCVASDLVVLYLILRPLVQLCISWAISKQLNFPKGTQNGYSIISSQRYVATRGFFLRLHPTATAVSLSVSSRASWVISIWPLSLKLGVGWGAGGGAVGRQQQTAPLMMMRMISVLLKAICRVLTSGGWPVEGACVPPLTTWTWIRHEQLK